MIYNRAADESRIELVGWVERKRNPTLQVVL